MLEEAVDYIIEKALLKKNKRLDEENPTSVETPTSLFEPLLDAKDVDSTHKSKKRYLDNIVQRSEVKICNTAGLETTSTFLTC